MNDLRYLAIIIEHDIASDLVCKNIALVKELNSYNKVFVFSPNKLQATFDATNIVIDDTCNTRSKIKNFVTSYFSSINFNGFLHVMEENVEIAKNPNEFLNAIEKAMDILDYSVYFSTSTDPCNYVYSKYNPRLTIHNDDEQIKSLGLSDEFYFTSNSNTAYVIYDYSKISNDLLKFNDKFNIPMYFVIEFLARRRNTKSKDSIYFMNQYFSNKEELGVFRIVNLQINDNIQQNEFASEDAIFKSMNINYQPDNNVDEVLSLMYEKLKSKLL